jgi:hypothetical protein
VDTTNWDPFYDRCAQGATDPLLEAMNHAWERMQSLVYEFERLMESEGGKAYNIGLHGDAYWAERKRLQTEAAKKWLTVHRQELATMLRPPEEATPR